MEINEPVKFTVLGENEATGVGRVAKSSSHAVELLTDQATALGAAVKLEKDQTLFLGEVCSCRPEGDGFAIGVELRHALYNTHDLARLAKRLLDESGRL